MKKVFIAGATGYLGRYLVNEYRRRGWSVRALVRNETVAKESGLVADEYVEAQATQANTLKGQLDGCDLVISSLGITRQQDGLSYRDVDYQANINILQESLKAGVPQFAYIHVLNANKMPEVPLVEAKQAFVDELRRSAIESSVIAPSGYFSDMADFLAMAQSGRAWLFGEGQLRLNPIDGEDLAIATADAIQSHKAWLDVGGPEVFTHNELAELAFKTLGKKAKITCLPDFIRRFILRILPYLGRRIATHPARFFLTALGMNMVGEPRGQHRLSEHFAQQLAQQKQANNP